MNSSIHIQLPDPVSSIIHTIESRGFEAYAVGGCVRDSMLGREPGDWDITTNAQPHEVKALFDKTIDTGIRHGTVTVMMDSLSYEVTTYRIDGEYSDHRRPDQVRFTSMLGEDLRRRDFTVNAMAYHPQSGLTDLFGGLEDLGKGIIRTVGDAKERFTEDALRMLRAVRFSAQLGFMVDPVTIEGIRSKAVLIKNISAERIREELSKTLVSDQPMRFALLQDVGLLELILPEFACCFRTAQENPYHIYNVAEHTLHAVSYMENDRLLRWVMLLHDIGKPEVKMTDEKGIDHFYGHPGRSEASARKILTRLKFDHKAISRICRLVREHDRMIEPAEKPVRRAVSRVGQDIFEDLLKVKAADMQAQNPQYLEKRLGKLEKIREIYQRIIAEQQCVSIRDLAVNGDDLLGLGFPPGREIKIILQKLLEMVLEIPEMNSKERLLSAAKEFLKRSYIL